MRSLITALVVVAAGALAFGGYYWLSVRPVMALVHQPEGEMEWLRHEYHLSDAQFQRVSQLHDEYSPKCAEMCRKISDQRIRLSALILAGGEVTPELTEALAKSTALELECRQALLGHIYRVAATMSLEDGRRYVATMSARIIMPAGQSKPMMCSP
ncbi:MAG: periplasmic heavy metal sensor [Verrucomicrobiota bacterium]